MQIDEDVYRAAKSIAAAENKTVGKVASALMPKALAPQNYSDDTDDIPSFRASENASPLTTEMVTEAEEVAG